MGSTNIATTPALIKLHGSPLSTCTTLVMTCLYEKDVDFELLPVDLFSGEHKHPPFLLKNPFGQIPVLEDADLTLFESRAITAYVAEKFKNTGCDLLRHQSIEEAALVKVWCEVESQRFHPAIFPIIFQYYAAPLQGNSPDQSVIDESLEKLSSVLDVYEAKLSGGSKYLAGDFYSLADLQHLPHTFYLMKTPAARVVEERPAVKAWWDDVSSRPRAELGSVDPTDPTRSDPITVNPIRADYIRGSFGISRWNPNTFGFRFSDCRKSDIRFTFYFPLSSTFLSRYLHHPS